jgi:cell fate regulator YaaT (PSP1 superfamily)
MNWIGEFRMPSKTDVACGAHVVVQTDRGIELGEQVRLTCPKCQPRVPAEQIKKYTSNAGSEFYRSRAGRILREASAQDVNEHERLNLHIRDDLNRCRESASRLNLDMKVVTAEHLLGGERIVFYFRSESRIDFRDLVRELAQYYQTRIEMRQVGARDEARLIADYEVCGRECCCKNFLKKLRPITMRMAKLQKSTLDPSKVSGRCGRLRCCLRYEHEGYDELSRKLPRTGARVQTEFGSATVIDRQILTQLLMVRVDDGQVVAVPVEELLPPDAANKPAPPPNEAPPDSAKDAPAEKPDSADRRADKPAPQRRTRRRRRRGSDANGRTADKQRADKERPADNSAGDADAPKPKADAGGSADNKNQEQDSRRPRRRRRRSRRGGGRGGSGPPK